MREACVNAGLHEVEVAMFVNIVPQNYDEAKTLVPSLMAAGEDGDAIRRASHRKPHQRAQQHRQFD